MQIPLWQKLNGRKRKREGEGGRESGAASSDSSSKADIGDLLYSHAGSKDDAAKLVD